MDEEYQNTVNQTSSSNPWADFEPIDTPPVNNINNQRTISRPEAPSSGRIQPQPGTSSFTRPIEPQQPARPNPFDQNFGHQSVQQPVAINNIQQQPQTHFNTSNNPQPTPNPQVTAQPTTYQTQPMEYENVAPQSPRPVVNSEPQFQQNVNSAQPAPAPQQPVAERQATATSAQPQYQQMSNPNQYVQQVNTQQAAAVFVNTEQITKPPSAFENIAWSSESSGLEDYSRNLAEPSSVVSAPTIETNPTSFNQNINTVPANSINMPVNPDSSFANAPQSPASEHQSLFKKFGPKADTTIDPASAPTKKNIFSRFKFPKISFKQFKLKYLLFALLALVLIGGASFAIIKFRNNSVKSTKLKPENQIVAEDIIELAKNNKADEIIKKYVRESNQASFPKDQFKESVLKLSQASSGKPTYISENTAKIIVQPDTNPSDMNAYIYTTNYAGYKGKIYIRVDVFKNSADGKWYLYALAYNSKELKPDLTSSAQPEAEPVAEPAAQ